MNYICMYTHIYVHICKCRLVLDVTLQGAKYWGDRVHQCVPWGGAKGLNHGRVVNSLDVRQLVYLFLEFIIIPLFDLWFGYKCCSANVKRIPGGSHPVSVYMVPRPCYFYESFIMGPCPDVSSVYDSVVQWQIECKLELVLLPSVVGVAPFCFR